MKKVIFLLVIIIVTSTKLFAQNGIDKMPPPPPPQNKVDKEKTSFLKEDIIFSKVEVEAEFPGGTKEWGNFLRKTLNADVPINNNAKRGKYTVVVRFIVDKDGAISNVTPETNLGYGMEKEVIRVISRGPNWIPAQQNGRVVKAYRRQPVTFVVQ